MDIVSCYGYRVSYVFYSLISKDVVNLRMFENHFIKSYSISIVVGSFLWRILFCTQRLDLLLHISVRDLGKHYFHFRGIYNAMFWHVIINFLLFTDPLGQMSKLDQLTYLRKIFTWCPNLYYCVCIWTIVFIYVTLCL